MKLEWHDEDRVDLHLDLDGLDGVAREHAESLLDRLEDAAKEDDHLEALYLMRSIMNVCIDSVTRELAKG